MHQDHCERFEATGLVKLPGLLPDQLTGRVLDLVHEKLEQAGVREKGGWRGRALADESARRLGAKLLEEIRHAEELAELVTPKLEEAVETAAGGPVRPMMKWPQLLFTFPERCAWSLPHDLWHVDLPKLANRRTIPGVQTFAILDTVNPGGGGTVVVQGAQRFLYDIPFLGSKQIVDRLRREPYFRALMSKQASGRDRFLRETVRKGDTNLRVVELTGRRGDVYLMDMRLLHSRTPNVAGTPRIMWTQRFLTEATHTDLAAVYAQMRARRGTAAAPGAS